MAILKKVFFRCNLIIGIALLFSSCSVIKRHYTKGFYVSGKSSDKNLAKNNTATIKSFYKEKKTVDLPINEKQTLTAQAPISNNLHVVSIVKKNILAVTKRNHLTEGCDTLFLKNGTIIAAKILEISEKEVKYQYCQGANKDFMYILKTDVEHIIFSNGVKETFKITPPVTPKSAELPLTEKTLNGFALAGFILSLLFYPAILLAFISAWGGLAAAAFTFIISGLIYLLAFIFSIVGIVQITQNHKYKGLALAIIGLAICLIPLILVLKSYL